MHSSRMRTVCCSGHLVWRGVCLGGVSAQGGGVCPGGVCLGSVCLEGLFAQSGVSQHAMGQTHPPVDRILDTQL